MELLISIRYHGHNPTKKGLSIPVEEAIKHYDKTAWPLWDWQSVSDAPLHLWRCEEE